MSFYICFAPPNGCLSKKSYPCLRGIAGIKRNTHHHKCLITSYSITVCLVLRCTGGFCYSPHSNRQGGGENDVIQRIQGKYRTPVLRIL